MSEERFVYKVQWLDPQANIRRTYQLVYYPNDGTIEMFDMMHNRQFLRRMKHEAVEVNDLNIGSSINVNGRLLNIVDYGNEYTRSKRTAQSERTVGIIRGELLKHLGDITHIISRSQLKLVHIRSIVPSIEDVRLMLNILEANDQYSPTDLAGTTLILLEMVGLQAVEQWQLISSNEDADVTIEKKFGSKTTLASKTEMMTEKLSNIFFSTSNKSIGRSNAIFTDDVTLTIIKPHAVKSDLTSSIIQRIEEEGFDIIAVHSFVLQMKDAEEFFEIYKGVLSDYPKMVNELCNGPCIALELQGKEAQKHFRNFCGPFDPEIGRTLRPKTLRAQFGIDKVRNAIHCTDLPEDSLLEIEYFFKILSN
ncbi:hypothetical protein SNEBB_005844 [Seison nebaliae]|nr:hypothetical protein SNEBB_005844 [Seison nebaliae]